MDKRPIKVTGPKQYHLRGHHNHFPRANLEGATDPDAVKAPRKSPKTAWKMAADYSAQEEQQLTQHWLEKARQALGPEQQHDDEVRTGLSNSSWNNIGSKKLVKP